jgi:hypothetical protein
MNIKIECGCGTRFSFDVEPVNGRMPVDVACPGCGTSALEVANAEIKRRMAEGATGTQAPAIPAIPSAPASAPGPSIPPSPSMPSIPARPPASAAPPVRPVTSPGGGALRVSIPGHGASPSAPAPQPAPAAPAAPRMTPGSIVPSGAAGLRINKAAAPAHAAAPTAAAPVAAGAGPADANANARFCNKHQSLPAADSCRVCGKPICLKCMEQFGYLCSVFCREKAEATGMKIPRYKLQKRGIDDKRVKQAQRITAAVGIAAVVFLGVWFWYAWFARNPKVVYSIPQIPPDPNSPRSWHPTEFFQLIAPGQFLSVKSKTLELYDVVKGEALWSARLESDAEATAVKAAKEKNDAIMKATPKTYNPDTREETTEYKGLDPLGERDDEGFFSNPDVAVTTNDVWLWYSDRLLRFDRQSGSPKDVPVKDGIRDITQEGDSILVVTHEPTGREVLTQIMLSDGSSQNEEITPAKTNAVTRLATARLAAARMAGRGTNRVDAAQGGRTRRRRDTGGAGSEAGAAPGASAAPAGALATAGVTTPEGGNTPEDDDQSAWYDERFRNFIPAGPNVVRFDSKLLQENIIQHAALQTQQPKKPLLVDSDNLTAGQSMRASVEMANSMRGPAVGETEDLSTFQVRVHRLLASGVDDWTNVVTGEPSFIPLTTVDLVTAGKSVYVLDKNNKKLWDAKLSNPAVPQIHSYFGNDEANATCLELKDSIVVADTEMITCFDIASGAEKWHLGLGGLTGMQDDGRGHLYLTSNSTEGGGVATADHPLITKVDERTGKEVWRAESLGAQCLVSGKFVYGTWVSRVFAALKIEEGGDRIYNLNLISPSTGRRIWNYRAANRQILRTQVQQNWILLQFDDEMMVLKFFSL